MGREGWIKKQEEKTGGLSIKRSRGLRDRTE